MNRVKASLLAGPAVLALLLSGCTGGAGGAPSPVGQGTGEANADVPAGQALPTEITTAAPQGGAAVRLGDTEEAITKVGCTQVNDNWSMSGSNEGGAKVAVTTTGDKQTVVSASVVFDDGKLVDMDTARDLGSATITWDGDWFTVVGSGPFYDLMDPAVTGQDPVNFVVKASCPA
nr:lipoprotein LpqH [Tessaracoccus sp. MC1865]